MSLPEDLSTVLKRAGLSWAVTLLAVGFAAFVLISDDDDKLSKSEFYKWTAKHESRPHDSAAHVEDVKVLSRLTETVAALTKVVELNTLRLSEIHKDIREILIKRSK